MHCLVIKTKAVEYFACLGCGLITSKILVTTVEVGQLFWIFGVCDLRFRAAQFVISVDNIR